MGEPLTPEALVEMKERCARAIAEHGHAPGWDAMQRTFALIADLLDVIANPPTWTDYTSFAWRECADALRKEST